MDDAEIRDILARWFILWWHGEARCRESDAYPFVNSVFYEFVRATTLEGDGILALCPQDTVIHSLKNQTPDFTVRIILHQPNVFANGSTYLRPFIPFAVECKAMRRQKQSEKSVKKVQAEDLEDRTQIFIPWSADPEDLEVYYLKIWYHVKQLDSQAEAILSTQHYPYKTYRVFLTLGNSFTLLEYTKTVSASASTAGKTIAPKRVSFSRQVLYLTQPMFRGFTHQATFRPEARFLYALHDTISVDTRLSVKDSSLFRVPDGNHVASENELKDWATLLKTNDEESQHETEVQQEVEAEAKAEEEADEPDTSSAFPSPQKRAASTSPGRRWKYRRLNSPETDDSQSEEWSD